MTGSWGGGASARRDYAWRMDPSGDADVLRRRGGSEPLARIVRDAGDRWRIAHPPSPGSFDHYDARAIAQALATRKT
jgi:hypothetical protein